MLARRSIGKQTRKEHQLHSLVCGGAAAEESMKLNVAKRVSIWWVFVAEELGLRSRTLILTPVRLQRVCMIRNVPPNLNRTRVMRRT